MILKLSKPIRRALALAFLIATITAVVSITILPLVALRTDLTERIEQTRDLVGRLEAAAATPAGSVMPQRAAILVEQSRRSFTPGESETIRSANAQAAVVQALAAEGLKPRSVRILPGRVRAGLTLVGQQVQLQASLPQLKEILTRLDGLTPRLLVEDLQIQAAPTGVVAGNAQQSTLEVHFDVFGIEGLAREPEQQP